MEWHRTWRCYDSYGWYENTPETIDPDDGYEVWIYGGDNVGGDIVMARYEEGDFIYNNRKVEPHYWCKLIIPEIPTECPVSDYKKTQGDWNRREAK